MGSLYFGKTQIGGRIFNIQSLPEELTPSTILEAQGTANYNYFAILPFETRNGTDVRFDSFTDTFDGQPFGWGGFSNAVIFNTILLQSVQIQITIPEGSALPLLTLPILYCQYKNLTTGQKYLSQADIPPTPGNHLIIIPFNKALEINPLHDDVFTFNLYLPYGNIIPEFQFLIGEIVNIYYSECRIHPPIEARIQLKSETEQKIARGYHEITTGIEVSPELTHFTGRIHQLEGGISLVPEVSHIPAHLIEGGISLASEVSHILAHLIEGGIALGARITRSSSGCHWYEAGINLTPEISHHSGRTHFLEAIIRLAGNTIKRHSQVANGTAKRDLKDIKGTPITRE